MTRAIILTAAGVLALTTAMIPLPRPQLVPSVPRRVHHVSSRRNSPQILRFLVTAYCPCRACCGKTDAITATGTTAVAGRTVAVDPRLIPLGSRLFITSLGERVAEDTGGIIRGHRLDIFFPTHGQALEFGRRWLDVQLLPAPAPSR